MQIAQTMPTTVYPHPGFGSIPESFLKEMVEVKPFEGLTATDLDKIAQDGEAIFELGGKYHAEDVVIPDFIPGGWAVKWMGTIGSSRHGRLVLIPNHPRCIEHWLQGRIKNLMVFGYSQAQATKVMELREVKYKDSPQVATAVLNALQNPLEILAWSHHWAVSKTTVPGSDPHSWRNTFGRNMPYRLAERHEAAVALILQELAPVTIRAVK